MLKTAEFLRFVSFWLNLFQKVPQKKKNRCGVLGGLKNSLFFAWLSQKVTRRVWNFWANLKTQRKGSLSSLDFANPKIGFIEALNSANFCPDREFLSLPQTEKETKIQKKSNPWQSGLRLKPVVPRKFSPKPKKKKKKSSRIPKY